MVVNVNNISQTDKTPLIIRIVLASFSKMCDPRVAVRAVAGLICFPT